MAKALVCSTKVNKGEFNIIYFFFFVFNNKQIYYRPFIIIYEDQSETEEIGVLNLTSVKVDYTEDLEDMLQVKMGVKEAFTKRGR
jgi:hypothetical protein